MHDRELQILMFVKKGVKFSGNQKNIVRKKEEKMFCVACLDIFSKMEN